MLKSRKSGQIISRNCSTSKKNSQQQVEHLEKIQINRSKLSYDIRIDHVDEESNLRYQSDTMRTVVKSSSSCNKSISIEEICAQNQYQIVNPSCHVSINQNKFSKISKRSLNGGNLEFIDENSIENIKNVLEQPNQRYVSHSQSIYYTSKPSSENPCKSQKDSNKNIIFDQNDRLHLNSGLDESYQSLHNTKKYICLKDMQNFGSLEKEVRNNIEEMSKGSKKSNIKQEFYASKYVSSELGNGHDSSLFGDSLAAYQNPLMKNQEIVKKLSHVTNIFKDIGKLKQQNVNINIQKQLKQIEQNLLEVEKGILRN